MKKEKEKKLEKIEKNYSKDEMTLTQGKILNT